MYGGEKSPRIKSLSARLYLASSSSGSLSPQERGIVASASAPTLVLDSTLVVEPTLANFLHVGKQTEGGVLGRWELSDARWKLIEPLFWTQSGARTVAVVGGRTREPCSKDSCGCWVPGHRGASCPANICLTKPAISLPVHWSVLPESSVIGGRSAGRSSFRSRIKRRVVIWYHLKVAIAVDQLSRLVFLACGLGIANQRTDSRSRSCRARK